MRDIHEYDRSQGTYFNFISFSSIYFQKVAVHSMTNVVELVGMVQQHVVVDQHVHLEMHTIHNVYHLEDHSLLVLHHHHFLVLVVTQLVQ
jgi:hypothetical protein